ncbi:MAG: LLM class flavin-dependent oxidoreductase [Pseudomonadota bacterium]
MEFSLFAHMERLTPEQGYGQLYEDFVGLCQMADAGGMRAVWTGEHHAMEFAIAPNPFLTIADLAHHTKNVRLGTGTIVAPFWHPVRLAGEAAATDQLTRGRLELGIARGAYAYEYERLMPGMDAWEAGQRLRETAPLLQRLWDGDCEHEGTYYKFPAASAAPAPTQPGGPPIWVAARDPNSHAFAVEHGFNVQVTPLWQGLDEISTLMERFETACHEAAVRRPKIMLLHHTYVGGHDDEVDRAADQLGRFYCTFGAWFQNKRRVQKGFIDPLTDAEVASNKMMAPRNMRRDLTVGTAGEVIDQIKRYEDLGFDEYAFWIDSGMSHEQKSASLSRFIDDVMPAFH